jgi:hypothetical protein
VIRPLVRLILLTLIFAIATRIGGWWGVPVVAAAWGVVSLGDGLGAAVAACLAWAALLVRDAAFGPFGDLAATLGALFHASPALVIALTLFFPMLLAWSAAVVGGAVSGAISGAGRSRATSSPPVR